MNCNKEHRYEEKFKDLPLDQGGKGRHKCAGCAYDKGFEMGKNFEENIDLDLMTLPDSQAGTVRHKSPHAAFAKGYQDGIMYAYEQMK